MADARQKCLQAFQLLRRLQCADSRGYVVCISCGSIHPYNEMDAGHYIPRGNRATELEPDNVWPQCKRCNRHLSGNYANYRMNLILRIGQVGVERLENLHGASLGSTEALSQLCDDDKLKSIQRLNSYEYEERRKTYAAEIRRVRKAKGLV